MFKIQVRVEPFAGLDRQPSKFKRINTPLHAAPSLDQTYYHGPQELDAARLPITVVFSEVLVPSSSFFFFFFLLLPSLSGTSPPNDSGGLMHEAVT